MNILARPIEMITVTKENGTITPIKFKMKSDDTGSMIIRIDKILFTEKERIAGNHMILYRCKSLINDMERTYEIKYELSTCKWILFRID